MADRGFDAGSVTAWRDARFTPYEAADWAARWIRPADAREWRAAAFSAVEAFMWRAQRITPSAATAFIRRGVRHPLAAARSVSESGPAGLDPTLSQ